MIRFFWPLFVFWPSALLGLISVVDTIGTDRIFWNSQTIVLALGALALLKALGTALTVDGLLKWHRHYSLLEATGGTRDDRAGRRWRLFWQWFLLGLVFVSLLTLSQFLIFETIRPIWLANLRDALSHPDHREYSNVTQFIHASATLVIIAITVFVSFLFSLIFKRHCVRIAYIATDARSGAPLPRLDRLNIHHTWLNLLLAASLAIPIIVFQLFRLTYGLDVAGLGLPNQTLWEVKIEVFTAPSKLSMLTSFGTFMLVIIFIQFFYPMLVFATTVSLYYREHVRPTLSTDWRPWRKATPEPQAASAP